jgi:hypothetical protein
VNVAHLKLPLWRCQLCPYVSTMVAAQTPAIVKRHVVVSQPFFYEF